MESYQILSRRAGRKVDFKPDKASGSPSDQLRRLSALLRDNFIGPDEITDCPEAFKAYKEYCYRKIYTSTTHEQYQTIERIDPDSIDWAIAIHAVDAAAYQSKRNDKRSAQ